MSARQIWGSPRKQFVMALISIVAALAVAAAEAMDSGRLGGPIGMVMAALFLANGLARLWLWRYLRRQI